ncbi:MAG TPA: M48 family metalloprotease [Dehalococcoidia bacterium]|nr:M48 family metalloprotease [Dehalococcoidia bacterium]
MASAGLPLSPREGKRYSREISRPFWRATVTPGSVRLGNMPHNLATALYKLVYGNARMRDSEELRRVEGVRAFFVNDPSRAWNEIRELSQIDRDVSGTIDYYELMELHQKEVRLGASHKLMELFTTHPNMLKRIKHLSTLNV